MKWKCVVTLVTCMRIGAVFEQEPDCIRVMHGHMQRGRAIVTLVNETWLPSQKFAQRSDVSRGTRVEERLNRGCRCHGCRL